MLTFTLSISCLTTSNLPLFMDLTFQVPMQYCSLQHRNLASITSHIHNWVLFFLWFYPFILSGIISPLISSSILSTYRPGSFIFQCPIFLPFHTGISLEGMMLKLKLQYFGHLMRRVESLEKTLMLRGIGGRRRRGRQRMRWLDGITD